MSPSSKPLSHLAPLFGALLLVAGWLSTVAPVAAAPTSLPAPPAGGLTQGLAGTDDPVALAQAQSFEVETVWLLDAARQRWLVYIPGAPDSVNTLAPGALRSDSIVTIRRPGQLPIRSAAVIDGPLDAAPAGNGQALATPPAGGLVQGISGTNDPRALVAGQAFPVQTLFVLDVPSQQWLVYVPGAPDRVNTLSTGVLQGESVVTVRRAPLATPEVAYNQAAEARLVALVNEERVTRGLSRLAVDTRLIAVARKHSADMAARDYFAHDNPDGLDPFDRMRAGDITYGHAGENLARAATTERAHQLLMESEGHRENILNPHFRRIGIGAVDTPLGRVFTQLFSD